MNNELKFIDIITLTLSIYTIISLIIENTFNLLPETRLLMTYIDHASCFVFLIDFIINTIKNKLNYLKYGWIDLLACIPNISYFRAIRILQIIKLFRIIKSVKNISLIINNKNNLYMYFMMSIFIFVMIFSSIMILEVETAKNSNIKTAGDAVWWLMLQ